MQASQKYEKMLQEEVQSGKAELERSALGLFLSGLSAGVDIGFSLLALAVSLIFLSPAADPLLRRFVIANAYSVGFIFVKLGASELFTEHTTLAVFPVLEGRSSVKQLARVWGLVYAGNLLGSAALAAILVGIGTEAHIIVPRAYAELAQPAVFVSWWVLLVTAILAGWMMGLLSWLTSATKETIGQIVCIWLVSGTIGLTGMRHVVVGNTEVLAGLLSGGGIGLGDYAGFLLWATLGNAIGGVAFAVLKQAHATRGANS